jgi:hypothetical protein
MKFSRSMLTVLVLLVGGLMAVSEAPEILTLSDNVSNDCETVEITRPSARKCAVTDSPRKITPGQPLLSSPAVGDAVAHELMSPSSRSSRGLLLLLVTQRK